MMNLYLVVRWGNPSSPDGPDGPDTIFLVRANDHVEAGWEVDCVLPTWSKQVEGNRAVQDFAHLIVQIADNELGEETDGWLVHGPWFEAAIIRSNAFPSWYREERDGVWLTKDETFPDEAD